MKETNPPGYHWAPVKPLLQIVSEGKGIPSTILLPLYKQNHLTVQVPVA